jgi:hypothetical protein
LSPVITRRLIASFVQRPPAEIRTLPPEMAQLTPRERDILRLIARILMKLGLRDDTTVFKIKCSRLTAKSVRKSVRLDTAKGGIVIRALILVLVTFLIATFPASWLLMLFLGNFGTGLSYWGTLPLGILVSALLASVSSRSYSTV